jgi:hypothetical protein
VGSSASRIDGRFTSARRVIVLRDGVIASDERKEQFAAKIGQAH